MLKEKMKNFGSSIKSAVKNFFKRKNPAQFFIAMMALSLIIWLVSSLIVGEKFFTGIFFNNGTDLFMDYFNSIRDVFQGIGVYTERHVIYPPMANLIFLLCLRFVPDEYAATSFNDRYLWVNYPSAILSCLLFILIFAVLFLLLCQRYMRFNGKTKLLFSFFLLANVPMLYLLERGNIILISTLFTGIYIFTYDSKSKLAREIGLFSLAFAFSIKLYPAALGWMLIADKRYKEALRCVIYGILLLIIPSFFFGGPKCLIWMMENIFSFSSGNSGWDTISHAVHIPVIVLKIIFYIGIVTCIVFFILSSFFQKERWKVWTFACALFMAAPPLHAVYGWNLFLIPLILLCNEKTLNGKNLLYFLFIAFPFLFIPGVFPPGISNSNITINEVVILLCLIALLILCIVDTFSAITIRQKEKNNVSADF
ncbi:MAG: hypothetical protein DBY05_02370 [Clostridiales bacterium]|jgi:hypothetical protein|nr:DUF2029 domain-containing protein [Clostridia bacterium]PWM02488.1 MAG: hypothetical protein DBY05_02370 [Clostridiales bacterium]